MPYSIALLCFCDSLYRTSESLRVSFECVWVCSVMLGLPLPPVFVLGTREWPQAVQQRSRKESGIAMKPQAYTLPPAPRRKRRQQLSVTAHLSFFLLSLVLCFLCYISTLLWFPFPWTPWWKCANPVRRTPTKQCNSSIWSSWSVFKNAVLGGCLDRSSFFLRSSSGMTQLSRAKGEKTTADSGESAWQ